MAVDDCNIDERDFEDLNLDDLEKLPSGLSCFNGFPESQLCVPPDATEDPEWFPSFSNDFISLSDVVLLSNHESFSFEEYELPSFNFPITPPEQHNEKTKEQTERMKLISHQTSSEANDHWIGFGRADFDGIKMKKSRTKKRCTKLENQKTKWSLAVNAVRKRCSHCQTDQTPQWRTGPMGPKTLCNACGVRFKSGRLVPEYRPAASPTFDSGRHSNFHKKILKRRGLISVNN